MSKLATSKKEIVRVEDVMVTGFDLVEGIATVADALRDAKHMENGCFIVNRRDDDDEYGILLLADVAKKILATDRAAERINVYEVMSKPVISVKPHMDVRYCARLFDKFGITRAPVMKDQKILGIVSFRDIVLKGVLKTL